MSRSYGRQRRVGRRQAGLAQRLADCPLKLRLRAVKATSDNALDCRLDLGGRRAPQWRRDRPGAVTGGVGMTAPDIL
jgi:hypothetical protein